MGGDVGKPVALVSGVLGGLLVPCSLFGKAAFLAEAAGLLRGLLFWNATGIVDLR